MNDIVSEHESLGFWPSVFFKLQCIVLFVGVICLIVIWQRYLFNCYTAALFVQLLNCSVICSMALLQQAAG